MDTSPKDEKSSYTIPTGFPVEIFNKVKRELKETNPKGLQFDTSKQRNAQFIQKGLSKPGSISYETLRRSAASVHVARICINVLKEKVTKTKWSIQPIDPQGKIDPNRVKQLEEFFRHPNKNNDTFRTMLDKMLEDLLVLDAVSLEKTRYPNGDLAEIFFVDSATIRPVYDEHGNQDIEIAVTTPDDGRQVMPVSYVQVMDNSQYGGPESGEVVAAWQKKDFIHFHMHPQGSMEGFGYGLSPLEGVLSVVANLLNADNYNGTYFEEGSFPPVILQLVGQMKQEELEAMREYLYQELTGNFHRPAIMAGGSKAEVLDLKNLTNNDMQFMQYMLFLSRLLAAAYGLSGQDIGLTDDLNKATSEVQVGLSQDKGYSSILHLLKETFNQEIIWKDFGFTELEFDWVADDKIDPKDLADLNDKALRNGTKTINEVRQANGDQPFEQWADTPMILTGNGYVPLAINKEQDAEEANPNESVVGGEEPYKEQDDEGKNKAEVVEENRNMINKSEKRTLYISRPVLNAPEIIKWAKDNGFSKTVEPKDMHVTVAYSKMPVDWMNITKNDTNIQNKNDKRKVKGLGDKNAVVLSFDSPKLKNRWNEILSKGASWDYEGYEPHVTISYDAVGLNFGAIKPFDGVIELGPEMLTEVNQDWVEGITEKSAKSIIKKFMSFLKSPITNPEIPDSMQQFEQSPVMFGALFKNDFIRDMVSIIFREQDTLLAQVNGFRELSSTYDWNEALNALREYIKKNNSSCGGVITASDGLNRTKYCIYIK